MRHQPSPPPRRSRGLLIGRVALALLVPASAGAQALSVDDAVAAALASPAIQVVLDRHLTRAQAVVAAETVRPNPSLAFSHEQVFGDAGVAYGETSAMLEQEVDLTDWRGRLRATLPYRESEARTETDEWRLQVAASVRHAFYAVRHREERLAVVAAWIAHLEAGVSAVAFRAEAGDVSAYEVRRVERELASATILRETERALLAEARASLAAWVPSASAATLSGDLLPLPLEIRVDSVELAPWLARLENRALAAGAEAEVWTSPGLRGWSVAAGYRLARNDVAIGHGFLVGLTLPLAVRDTDRARVQHLHAEADAARAELERARGLDEQARAATEERLRSTLSTVTATAETDRDAELTAMVETAYRAGEASLTELLDAYASESGLQLSRIDLQWEARRAALELDRLNGRGLPQ